MKTQTDYSTLSDDELSAMVAERVMSWHRVVNTWCYPIGERVGYRVCHEWNPATHIADAMQVADKMVEQGFCFQLTCFKKAWVAEFARSGDLADGIAEMDDSKERAICIAALKALNQ